MSLPFNFTRQFRNGDTQRELAELELPSTLNDGMDSDDGLCGRCPNPCCCSVAVIRVNVLLRRCARARAMARPWRRRRLLRLPALHAEAEHAVLTCYFNNVASTGFQLSDARPNTYGLSSRRAMLWTEEHLIFEVTGGNATQQQR